MPRAVSICTLKRRCSPWIIKVLGHRLLDRVTRTGQPQHNEQAHKCSDEVGICHLPSSAVRSAMASPPLLDEDDRVMLHLMHVQAATSTGTGSRSRQAFSSAANCGRTYSGIARRPISTAIIGAVPLMNASSVVRSTP